MADRAGSGPGRLISPTQSLSGGRVVVALFFFPRGGSAQVVRGLRHALPESGWHVTLACGSLGSGEQHADARSFFSDPDIAVVDYSPAGRMAGPLAAPVPFQPSYEDKPGAPDHVFAMVDDEAYEQLVAAWGKALREAGAAEADVLHLHHLTPANEAALREFPEVPIVGQLHGTEVEHLRAIEAGAPAHWCFAGRWAERFRGWAQACEILIVSPGATASIAQLLGVEPERIVECPSGVELDLFKRRALNRDERLAHWRRWLVEEPLGWDESGSPGTVAYQESDLSPFENTEAVILYVGRYTAVKRLSLLINAHTQVLDQLGTQLPLVLVGGHPGEWEGEHPLAVMRLLGNEQVFLAGWRPHDQLPQALNAGDLLVLPSVTEAFGLVLIEAMACGLPVIAADAHGPAEIVAEGTGWLVPPDDQNALAASMLNAVIDSEERRRRGARALYHARAVYGWPRIATRIAECYSKASDRPARSAC